MAKGASGILKTPEVDLVKCDAVPNASDVIRKNLLIDDRELGPFDVGVVDLPYLYVSEAYDHRPRIRNGKNYINAGPHTEHSWAHNGELSRYMMNQNEQDFIDRIYHGIEAYISAFAAG